MSRACKCCGKCCEEIKLPFNCDILKKMIAEHSVKVESVEWKHYVEDLKLMLEIFEFEATSTTVDGGDERWGATCKWYVPPNNGSKARCLHQDRKPVTCRQYPYGRKIIDTCGYKGRPVKIIQTKSIQIKEGALKR